MRLVALNMLKPSSELFYLPFQGGASFVDFFLCFTFVFIILSCLFHVIVCCKRADLLALLCVMFPCVFVILPYGVSDQVWYLIDSISDLCLRHYF